MKLEFKEKINELTTKLDSITEILYGLQLLESNSNDFMALNIADFLELPIEDLTNIRKELANFQKQQIDQKGL